MRILLSFIVFTGCFFELHAQSAIDSYRKADAATNTKDFKTAALAYAEGIRTEGDAAGIFRYRYAAAAFAQAGMTDSAFHYLNLIATSAKCNRTVAKNIENSFEFDVLQKDKRWASTLKAIQKKAESNGYAQDEYIYGRKDGIALTLFHIQPKIKPNGKAIIYVVSGGWVSSYNGIEVNPLLMEQFLQKGYSVFAVVHGSAPRYAIPDAYSDVKRAVRYVRYHAQKFAIDPQQIGITGFSAGGHLSLLIALGNEDVQPTSTDPVERVSARVQAAAVLFPPTDLLNWGGPGLNMVNAKDLVRARGSYGAIDFRVWNEKTRTYDEVSDTAARSKTGREISPIYYVSKDDPPVFIIHGDKDATVPLQQSQAMIAKLNEAGVKTRFIIKKGGGHNPADMMPEFHEFVNWFDEHLK
ncbi:MAG TPA: alpha/beta hydrolase [Lacibacter sp.]|nr:alpha/beta hydrolase [Lacibacter sp.]